VDEIGMTGTATDRLYAHLVRQVDAAGFATGPDAGPPVTEAELAELPEVVRRYLRFMGTVGRPRIWSFRANIAGKFRLWPWLGGHQRGPGSTTPVPTPPGCS
jgi:hypothetical protein